MAGNGLLILDGEQRIPVNADSGFANIKVKSLLEDKDGIVWAGTEGAGVFVFRDSIPLQISMRDGLGGNWIRDMVQDSKGDIWFATAGRGISVLNWKKRKQDLRLRDFRHFTTLNGMPQNQINCLHEDQQGRIWFGTTQKGLGYIDQKGKVHSIPLDGVWDRQNVRSIVEDSWGYLWFGTAEKGLGRLSLYQDSLDIRFYQQGLISTNIYLLGLDEWQNLWIGSEKGVDEASLGPDRQIIDIKHYGASEGFGGVETCQNAFFEDREGNLWFGSINGVSRFRPGKTEDAEQRPLLHISDIHLTYTPLSQTKYGNAIRTADSVSYLDLPWNENHISFDFLAISHDNPEKIRYRWKLNGLEEQFSRSSSNTSATYPNLLPGEYSFVVQAGIYDSNWGEESLFHFRIRPPFWQEWWFWPGIVALGVSLLALGFWLRIRQIRAKAAEEREKLEMEKDLLRLEQKALGLQMNPHFLFNALNSIQNMIALQDTKSARYYLAKFAKLMRLVLDNSRETYIPVEREIQTLETYLAIEQFSRGDHFDYEIELDDELNQEEMLVPPMLLQPFVENAIIHGVAHISERGIYIFALA